jgi:hypothetical protein
MMQIGIATAIVPFVAFSHFSPHHTMSATIRNPPQFLDIHMD